MVGILGLLDQFVFELVLLSLGEHAQLLNDLRVALQATVAYYVPRLAVPLSLRHLVVLRAHVHVTSCVSGVLLAAVVEARELLLEVSCAPSDVFFARNKFPFPALNFHVAHVLDDAIIAIVLLRLITMATAATFLTFLVLRTHQLDL